MSRESLNSGYYMQSLTRLIGLGFILLTLAAVALKAVVALPGPLGYAPVNLGLGPSGQPVEIAAKTSLTFKPAKAKS